MPSILARNGSLLALAFVDELSSGIAPLAAPELQGHFSLSYALAAGWTLTAMQLLAAIVEPPLFALADRYPKRHFISIGLAVLGASCIVAGIAQSYAVLLGALLVYGPATGCCVVIAQAALVDSHPDAREKILTRWTLFSCLGDLATPTLLSLLALVGAGWREAFVLVGVFSVVYGALLARYLPRHEAMHVADAVDADDPEQAPAAPLAIALRRALKNRALAFWSLALLLCSLLDETLVAFGSLYLRERLHLDAAQRGFVFGCWMVGAILGLRAMEKLLPRIEPLVLLLVASIATLLAYGAWLFAFTLPLCAASIALVGCFCGVLYPLAKAQAYRALPGQSGMVNAIAVVLTPIEMALPIGIGVVADRLGIRSALVLLALQPLGLACVALWSLRARRSDSSHS